MEEEQSEVVEVKTEETKTTTVSSTIDSKISTKEAEEIWDGRRKMAWVALSAIIIPTLYIVGFITNVELLKEMGNLMSWFYLALASVVCAYFGFTSWASIKGK